ncbi:hypothetical protein NBRC116600_13350 [Thalassotalea sp. SU-HH00458]
MVASNLTGGVEAELLLSDVVAQPINDDSSTEPITARILLYFILYTQISKHTHLCFLFIIHTIKYKSNKFV